MCYIRLASIFEIKGFLMKNIVNECFIFKSELMATLAISKKKILLLISGLQKMREKPCASAGGGHNPLSWNLAVKLFLKHLVLS